MRKRLIAILLCISTMLSLCTGFASAASSTIGGALGEVNITNGGYKMSYLSMNGVVRSQSYTYFNFKSASLARSRKSLALLHQSYDKGRIPAIGKSRREYQIHRQRSQQRSENHGYHC